jgi:hypothetical protein
MKPVLLNNNVDSVKRVKEHAIHAPVQTARRETMSRRAITNFCAIPTALFLVIIGILHTIVNVSGLRRALARGEIAARLGDTGL